MNEAIKEYIPSGKFKRLSYLLVTNQVKKSWDAINPNMINHSFKCYGVSNAINGIENGLILDFNKVEDIINQGRGIELKKKKNRTIMKMNQMMTIIEMNQKMIIMKMKMITIKVMKIVM